MIQKDERKEGYVYFETHVTDVHLGRNMEVFHREVRNVI